MLLCLRDHTLVPIGVMLLYLRSNAPEVKELCSVAYGAMLFKGKSHALLAVELCFIGV